MQQYNDRIDLKELFITIWKYKLFIFIFTTLVTTITVYVVYKMQNYYQTTTTIEIKSNGSKASPFAALGLGGAASLIGLGNLGGANDIGKHIFLLKSYKINSNVLNKINYKYRYFIKDSYKEKELLESNSTIMVKEFKLFNNKLTSINLKVAPVNKDSYILYKIGLKDKKIGEFEFNKEVNSKDFSILIEKKLNYISRDIVLKISSDNHLVYNRTISKNLTIQADKKAPFIEISYLDNIPKRGSNYIKLLLDSYKNYIFKDALNDVNITLSSVNKQIKELEAKVDTQAKNIAKYKTEKEIIDPAAQSEILLKSTAMIDSKLTETEYQNRVVQQVNALVLKNLKNIDTITPMLVELGDKTTIALINKLQEFQLKKSELSQEFTPAYPSLQNINRQINLLKTKIKHNLITLKTTIANKKLSLQNLQQKYKNKLKQVPKTEKDFKDISLNYKINEKLYAYLLQKRSALLIKKAEIINKIKVIEPIYTNPKQAKPKKVLIVIASFITAIILAIFIVFFREFLKGDE